MQLARYAVVASRPAGAPCPFCRRGQMFTAALLNEERAVTVPPVLLCFQCGRTVEGEQAERVIAGVQQ